MNLCGGICLGIAWILFIDGGLNIRNDDKVKFEWYFTIPMIVNTVGIVMTNVIDTNLLNPNNWLLGENVSQKVRIWFLSSFVITFCGVLGSMWIMVNKKYFVYFIFIFIFIYFRLKDSFKRRMSMKLVLSLLALRSLFPQSLPLLAL